MANIKDVAKKAGVSLATTSYALNGDPRIKKETRDKVLKAAREINYVPNGYARSLRRQKTNMVIVFVSSFGGPIYQEILETLNKKLLKENYRMVICNGAIAGEMLNEKNYDAVINIDSTINSEILKKAANFGYPIIETTRDIKEGLIYSLPIPGYDPVYKLIDEACKRGYKKIGFMHGNQDSYDNKQRYMGFLGALKANNIEPYTILQGEFTTESGYDTIKAYINEGKELPEVLCCSNDEMAIGVMDYLKKINFDLNNIRIIGFDNIQIGEYYSPKLTTVGIDRIDWINCIVDKLICLLNKKEFDGSYSCKYEIIKRETF